MSNGINQKVIEPVEKWTKGFNSSEKKKYKWPVNICKNAQYYCQGSVNQIIMRHQLTPVRKAKIQHREK